MSEKFENEYERFTEETTQFLSEHPEYEQMFIWIQKHKLRSLKFFSRMFAAWKSGIVEWFLQNSLIEFQKTGRI